MRINNKLAVVPDEKVEDKSIAEGIIASAEKNAYINLTSAYVEVSEGVVILSEKVFRLDEYKSVIDAAQYALGVREIIDNLNIGYL